MRIARTGAVRVQEGGRLVLGYQWHSGARLFPGHFLVHRGAHVEVPGFFGICSGTRVEVNPGARLELGDGSGMSNDVRVNCYESISIGRGVLVAEGAVLRDSDDHAVDGKPMTAPIRIEDHAWIGMRAMVLKGVTIGRGAIVAAGAVVTSDVPPGTMVGGVPARVLRSGVTWEE
ncbi:acyltransferase [Modestobacter sp. SYSU DS0657]